MQNSKSKHIFKYYCAKPQLNLTKQASLNTYLKDQQIYATLGEGDDAEGRFQNEKLQASNNF